MRFPVILADPPWHFAVRSEKGAGRSASQHYPTQGLDRIKSLPVRKVAAADCMLLLWVTRPLWPQSLAVMEAWGFTYKTVAFTWTKMTKDGSRPKMGLGYYTRAECEYCLLGTIGSPKRIGRGVEEAILAPSSRHSAKPPEQYRRIERLTDGPFLELYARAPQETADTRTGDWTFLGNEIDGRQIGDALCALAEV